MCGGIPGTGIHHLQRPHLMVQGQLYHPLDEYHEKIEDRVHETRRGINM